MGPHSLVAAWGEYVDEFQQQTVLRQTTADPKSTTAWRDPNVGLYVGLSDGELQGGRASLHADASVVVAFDGILCPFSASESAIHPVLDAYRRWGIDCARHLSGEFGFVLWDRRARRLLVASDRSGIRSLAYFFDGRTFLVASRVLSLSRFRVVRPRWNRVYFAHVWTGFWAQPPGMTALENIKRTRPGATLVLQDGQLREIATGDDDSIRNGASPRDEDVVADFWSHLRRATQSRFSGTDDACLSLSGGLDSTLIGAAMTERATDYDAFSLVLPSRPDLDESSVIDTFLRRNPRIRWHPVACDELVVSATTVAPITDDPIVTADPLRVARTKLFRHICECGFRSVLDGEGGDELFGMSRRIGDLPRRGKISELAAVLAMQKRRRALVWRGLVVPRLPPWARTLWDRREYQRVVHSRPWLNEDFWNDAATREASEQHAAWAAADSSSVALHRLLAHPCNVGSRSGHRLLASFAGGLEIRSPFLDQGMVDFAMRVPPRLLWTSSQSKPFLRMVGEGHVPDEVLRADKHVALYRYMRNRAIAQENADAIAQLLAANPMLSVCVRADVVMQCLRLAANGTLFDKDADALYMLIQTARWMQSVTEECGIP